MDEDTIHWEAPEFIYHQKTADWYWILGVVVVVGALIAILLHDTLFAVFLVIGGFVVAAFASKHPEQLEITVNRKGVIVNGKIHPHRAMDTFWVEDHVEGRERLLMTPKNTLSLQIVIPIQGITPDEVREYMEQYVHEEEQSETIAEQIMEWAKF